MFLYSRNQEIAYYDFVPYLYGSYSFQLAQDVDTLRQMGWLENNNDIIKYSGIKANSLFDYSVTDFYSIEGLRGTKLMQKVYREYPYYAINSTIAENILSKDELHLVRDAKKRLERNDHILFTIGYEGISVETYINTLIQNDVKVLCDVRDNPLSRKFGFSKNNLQSSLKKVNIGYVHVPELGIISDKRKSLETKADYDELFDNYKMTLSEKKSHLESVYNLLQSNQRIALACFEHDPAYCHRHVIRDYLIEYNDVCHEDL
jgi:uncharacterized protein (DUF488 family)